MVVEETVGGTARHVLDLAAGCHSRGLSVHLVCAALQDPTFRGAMLSLRERGIAVDTVDMRRNLDPLRDITASIRIRDLILRVRPDVLHLHSGKAGALGRGAVATLRRRGPPVVYTPHAYAFLTQIGLLNRRRYWCAERAALPWTDRVVAVSQSEGRVARRLGAGSRVLIIPNGVDATRTASYRPRERTGFQVGWLGRLVWQKHPEAAVMASSVLSRLGIDHGLLLGGDGPDRDRVHATIQRLRAESWVRMTGFVPDTEAFHARCDVLLITSRADGLPYVGLDAMAHGVPIVGFDVPGVQDLVEHGVTGLLGPPGDSGALAAHLARLARDVDLRRAMGLAAQRCVRKQFRLEDQLDGHCELYSSLKTPEAVKGRSVMRRM